MSETQVGGIAADRLRSIIERIERLEAERKALAADIKDIKTEAKSAGFDVKVINAIIKERAMDRDKLAEFEELKDVYRHALGDLADTPLGEAAVEMAAPRHRRSKPDNGVTMKMLYKDDDGREVTTEPFTQADLQRATARLERMQH